MNKEKITMIECFSGIGAQKRGIDNTELFDLEVIATSDIDKDAILSYACIHHGLTAKMIDEYKSYPPLEDMKVALIKANIGYDPQKDIKYDWNEKSENTIRKYWLACKLQKQYGDISNVKSFPYADVLTFSFPCQSISISGRQEGIIQGETKSGLVYEVIRILDNMKSNNKLPKYLLLENVKNLVGTKFIKDFENLNIILDEIGYNTYWNVLNGKNCGVPQNRERVFGIYIRKDIDTFEYKFPKPFDTGIRLKDILEKEFDNKYYLSESVQNRFVVTDNEFKKNIIGTKKPPQRTIGQRDLVYNTDGIMGTLVSTDYKQPKQILDNQELCIKNKGFKIRKLTPTEVFLLMGFTKEDIDKCYDLGMSDTQLYRQGGNSIIPKCIQLLFEHLYKSQYDNKYVCYDENLIKNN